MKGYFLIIGTLVVVISALITLNIFFQQSLQMEMAEQFNKQQLLLSRSVTENMRAYIHFLKEKVVSDAQVLSKVELRDSRDFSRFSGEILRHGGVIPQAFGIIGTDGSIRFFEGDSEVASTLTQHIVKSAQAASGEQSGAVETVSHLAIFAPLQTGKETRDIVFITIRIQDIANHFIGNIKSGSRGYAWMMDKQGNLLYHPTQPGMVGRNLYSNDATCFRCHVSFDLEKRIIEGKASNYGRYISPSGEDKVIAFSTMAIEGLTWVVAVSAPFSEVTHAIKQSMRLYAYLIISIFLTASIGSVVLIILNKKRIQAVETVKHKEELEQYALELEKKVMERTSELTGEKEKLNTIVSAIGGGIILIDKHGVIQWTNDKIRDMAGKDVTGVSCEEVCVDCKVTGMYTKDDIDTIIMSNLFGQAGRHFQVTTAPIQGEDGVNHGYIRLVQDITEMKKMEEQIMHSEKLASIGRLAAGIAHEIGNPLTSIFSFVQILREMEEDPFKKDSLETIYFHVNRISETLKQLSGFTKMPKEELKQCHVNEILGTSINLMQYDKKAKNIIFEKDLAADIPDIVCDGDQLSQVFVNLTLNAVDAMPDGGTLSVSSALMNGSIVIGFADTGSGIPASDLPKIFDPFYTTKEKGTGLGLAVSYSIIKKMNGVMTVDSEIGKGTTFTITIPVFST